MAELDKICKECQKIIKSRRKNQCDSCYAKVYWAKNKPPSKEKIRHENCILCGKKRKPHGRSVKYCNWCAIQKSYEKNPGARKKRLLQARNSQRIKKGIDINLPRLRGEFGKGHLNKKGYRMLCKPGHPNSQNQRGGIGEHTYVMSEYLKRPLAKHECVHHKNGIKDDNRIENLELWSKAHPSGQRVEDKIKWAKEFLQEYGYTVTS